MSALIKPPKGAGFKLASNSAGLNSQLQHNQGILKRHPGNQVAKQRISQIRGALGSLPGGADATPQPTPFQQTTDQANQATSGLFSQMAQQQPFQYQPFQQQDYSQMRQDASNRAMEDFNRNMNPQFKQQEQDFRAHAAAMGIQEGSDAWNKMYQNQVTNPQAQARQNAAYGAFQAGQGEQAQAFGQNLQGNAQNFNQGYQAQMMPWTQLGALSPYYQMQGQFGLQQQNQAFLGNQAALDRTQQTNSLQAQLANSRWLNEHAHSGGGGGSDAMALSNLNFEHSKWLQDDAFNKQLIAAGMSPTNTNSAGSSFASGLGTGAGLGFMGIFK